MTCEHVLDLVEPIASGDLPVEGRVRDHFETCPRCASALATARRLEMLLATRPAPEAPARFAAAVQQRVRRERWHHEQQVDRIFNVAMVVAGLLVAAGGAFLVNSAAIFNGAGLLAGQVAALGDEVFRNAALQLNTYAAATALLLSGLAMWWWADTAR